VGAFVDVLPALIARSVGFFFAMAVLAAVLADLLGFGISRPLNFLVLGRKTTLFRIAAIRPRGQHFVCSFRELNADLGTCIHSCALLCTPVTDESHNGVLLSTFSGRR